MKPNTEVSLRCENWRVIGDLPCFCIHCGEISTGTRDVKFEKSLFLAMLTFGLIGYLLTPHPVTAKIPVCAKHAKGLEFSSNQRAIGALVALVIIIATLFGSLAIERVVPAQWGTVVDIAMATLALLVLIGWYRYIRSVAVITAKKMTEGSVVLINVAPVFAEAVAAQGRRS